jgi:hypothetical protein
LRLQLAPDLPPGQQRGLQFAFQIVLLHA